MNGIFQFNTRTAWIDFLRGILIALVVIGHSQASFVKYIYWFHMPAFFMLSGYLFKPVSTWSEFKAYALKKTKQLLIPYFIFLILFLTARCLNFYFSHTPFNYYLEIHNALYGGRVVAGVYGALWFISVLWFTQLVYAKANVVLKRQWLISLFVVTAYLLAHVESYLLATRGHLRPIPLNLDVALLAIAYYHIGYIFKGIPEKFFSSKIFPITTAVTILLSGVMTTLGIFGKFSYTLDLKNIHYTHPLLDLVIPLLFSIAFFGISYYTAQYDKTKLLITIGLYSLPIMYLHRITDILFNNNPAPHWIMYSLIGIFGSLAVGWILQKYKTTRVLFLGTQS